MDGNNDMPLLSHQELEQGIKEYAEIEKRVEERMQAYATPILNPFQLRSRKPQSGGQCNNKVESNKPKQ